MKKIHILFLIIPAVILTFILNSCQNTSYSSTTSKDVSLTSNEKSSTEISASSDASSTPPSVAPTEVPSQSSEPSIELTEVQMMQPVPDKKVLPSAADRNAIYMGMPLKDVYQLVGNPQRAISVTAAIDTRSSTLPAMILEYNSSDGVSFYLGFLGNSASEQCVAYASFGSNEFVHFISSSYLSKSDFPDEPMLKLVPDKDNLPSASDMDAIHSEMTPEEVYQIAGNPQRFQTVFIELPGVYHSAVTMYEYDTSSGTTYYIIYEKKYGVYGNTPHTVKYISNEKTFPCIIYQTS